jgi:type I restriction enzyme R subunit
VETRTPAILTTSQLLTTGVDAPTCKNVVLARVIGSMCDFKQIIGRGTRVRDDYGKLWFNIVDYTGSATRMFADPDFDGDPARITEEDLNTDRQAIEIREESIAQFATLSVLKSSSRRQRSPASIISTAAGWKSLPI